MCPEQWKLQQYEVNLMVMNCSAITMKYFIKIVELQQL